MDSSEIEIIMNYIPSDHAKQVASTYFLNKIFNEYEIQNVIDLGCGKGESKKYFLSKNSNIKWIGVDVESSPEVDSREVQDSCFVVFDGINIPFKDNSMDLIYCNQVLEHVEYPRELIKEVSRVLKKGGIFIGSVSYLEPLHSFSIFNITPYGFVSLLNSTNLKLIELRPGIDVFTMLLRRIFMIILSKNFIVCRYIQCFIDRYLEKESPFNFLLTVIFKLFKRKNKIINKNKLFFCAQYRFYVKKTKE